MQEIYEFVTANGRLTEPHFLELRTKRGFTEDTIKTFRFFSGGSYLAEIEEEMLRNFDSEKLVRSGVFNLPDGAERPTISDQLTGDRIIIPYLDREGKANFIRPHKMGLKAGVQIYHDRSAVFNENPLAILTESEFKAVAAMQLGFKAIGIPGVGSFAGDHFKRLTEFLQKSKIKAVCIINDNEVKDDPSFPNYKDKPINRYDTEYFSYIMAKMLFNEGIDARIGRLPDVWRVNGKIDIDGALAAGKTAEDLRWVIQNSKPHKVYLEDLPKEAKDIVLKKVQKKYHRSNVHISFGKYVATRYQGRREWDEEISNFIIKILATHDTSDGMIREATLIDAAGKHSKSFSLKPDMMTDNGKFREACMAMGNFIWKGRLEDLAVIWEEQFFEDDGRVIVEPDHVGFVSREKIWLFSNIAIHSETGEEFRPDGDGIFWMGDRGYKPVPIAVTSGKQDISEGIPYLNSSQIDKYEILKRFEETIGRFESMIAMGWIAGFAFMEEIYALYGCYPFLFVTGKRGSGKSTIAEWITRLSGVDGAGRMISDTTAVAVQRLLGYYSCLPVFLDEFRNNKLIQPKVGMFRNVYNRQSAGKGTREGFGIREGKVRGGIIISGEETPEDNALLTRCVVIGVSLSKRKENHYNWFQANKGKFSYYIRELIKNRKSLKEQFLNDVLEGKAYFVKKGLDDRIAIHYSIIGSGFGAAFGSIPADFMEFLSKETLRVKEEYEQEQIINVFWEDILAMVSSGAIKKGNWVVENGMIYIYYHSLYMDWSENFRRTRGSEPFKSSAIRDYLKEEPGFVQMDYVKRIGGVPRKTIVFELLKTSEQIQQLAESVIDHKVDGAPQGGQSDV